MKTPALLITSLLAIACTAVYSQSERMDRYKAMSERWESRGLAESFKGITTDGEPQTGVFGLKSTGVSTQPVKDAAIRFLNVLTEDQRSRTSFEVDDDEWRKWMNQHFYIRQGVGFDEMSETQRTAAFELMGASLSAEGLQLSKDIMKLNYTLGEINDNFEDYGEWLYWITIMGEPSDTEPWGWQIDGHHLIINYFVLGDQVVMTPTFVGSEPVIAETGKYRGISIMQDEQDMGLAMLRSLNEEQRNLAILEFSKDGNNNLTEAFKDNVVMEFVGIRGSELTQDQKATLLSLIKQYVDYMDPGHAEIKMHEVVHFIDDTWFAWIGGHQDDAVYYYRVHSPVILIEFDHQKPVATRQLYGSAPHRQHIHAVIRTPNGNDYGKDLLRQHYEQHKHD